MTDKPVQQNQRRASPMDMHVGKRIRIRRRLLGLTQGELADRLDITFQQVQKYEWGANRVGAGRLYDLSIALEVPIQYFFNDGPHTMPGRSDTGMTTDILSRNDIQSLVRAFSAIDNKNCRNRLIDLCEALARSSQSEQPSSSST